MEAALELLTEGGVAAVSIEAVAARAGVGKATVYRRWPSRTPLVAEALSFASDQLIPTPETGSVRGDLRQLLGDLAAVLAGPAGQVIAGVQAEALAVPELGEALRVTLIKPRRDVLMQILRSGTGRGEVAPGTNVSVAVDMLAGAIFHRLLLTREQIDQPLVESLIEMVMEGIASSHHGPHAADPGA